MAGPRQLRQRRLIILSVLIVGFFIFIFRHDSDTSYPAPFRGPLQFQPSSYDWSTAKQHYPIDSPAKLPRGTPEKLPKIQAPFPAYEDDPTTEKRRGIVRATFLRSWSSYKKHAWLHDELTPVSGGFNDPFGGWAATLVDSLDTMWIMGLHDEFYQAAAAAVKIDWNLTQAKSANTFETTIRHLGGLLSAFDLSGEPALLLKARELGDMLYMAFDTPNRMPPFWLNFEDAKNGKQTAGTFDPSASPTSLSLEFTRLAQLTGDDKYFDAVQRVAEFLENSQEESALPGLWPVMIDFKTLSVKAHTVFSLGALADSAYEYLVKNFILLGGRGQVNYKNMYLRAMDKVMDHILFRPMLPDEKDVLFAGKAQVIEGEISLIPEGQHLACFLGGMFALGGRVLRNSEHIRTGERLAKGCAWAYAQFPTGLMPEIFDLVECKTPHLTACKWDEERWQKEGSPSLPKGFRDVRDARYILRPEAIESLFVLYRVTGQEEYRELAWTMFERVTKATATRLAYSAIVDVRVTGTTEKADSMESFWMAETLKYFYLIFSSPDTISLDQFVINTEAHPLKRSDFDATAIG